MAHRNSMVTMDGDGAWVEVRGCCGIVEYGTQRVRLRMEEGELEIEGERLGLERMDGEEVTIVGRVLRLCRNTG